MCPDFALKRRSLGMERQVKVAQVPGEIGIELFGDRIGQSRHSLPIRRRGNVTAIELDMPQARKVAREEQLADGAGHGGVEQGFSRHRDLMLRTCLSQCAKVRSGRLLKNTQIKGGHNGEDVVENVGLNRLVVGPDFILAEDIDLNGQPLGGRG